MPIGQVMGAHWILRFFSMSSRRSKGFLPLPVQLVDEGHDRGVAQAADFQQLLGLALHPLDRVDDHQDRVDGGQHPVGVLGKVVVAGGVQQVDLEALDR